MGKISKLGLCFLHFISLASTIDGSDLPPKSINEAADFFESQFKQIMEDLKVKEIEVRKNAVHGIGIGLFKKWTLKFKLPSDGVDRDSGGESGHLLKMSLMALGSF